MHSLQIQEWASTIHFLALWPPPSPHLPILLFSVFSRRPIRINMYTYTLYILYMYIVQLQIINIHYTICSRIMFNKRSLSKEIQMISIDQIFIIHVYVVFLYFIHLFVFLACLFVVFFEPVHIKTAKPIMAFEVYYIL